MRALKLALAGVCGVLSLHLLVKLMLGQGFMYCPADASCADWEAGRFFLAYACGSAAALMHMNDK